MPLSELTDLCELSIAKRAAGVTESLERILGLSRHDYVADEAKKVALARGICEIACFAKHRTDDLLALASLGTERGLIILEHALVLTHARNVAAAKIPEASVFCLLLVIFECFE